MTFDDDIEPVLIIPSLGPPADRANTIGSKCGVLFDAYVKQALSEPSAYSVDGPTSRTVTTLWAERRLRIKVGGRYWHTAKVHEWTEWCSGPYSPFTIWFLTVSLLSSTSDNHTDENNAESIQPWDLVKLQGLQSGAVYNGKFATVLGFDESKGRFQVKLSSKVLLVKPENAEKVLELTREVGRVNIHGGGTLIGKGGGVSDVNVDRDADEILSFEWLDAAEPNIDLSPLTMEEEQFQGPSDEMPPAELEVKRAVNLEAFRERTPTITGPPDCNPDGSPRSTPRRVAFGAYANEYADVLIEESRTDLLAFRATLMEQPLLLWNGFHIAERLPKECSIDAIKVMVEVLKKRFAAGCFRNMVRWVFEHFERPPGCNTSQEAMDAVPSLRFTVDFLRWTSCYSRAIGSKYEKSGEYRKAIPWYQQALDLGSRGHEGDPESVVVHHHDLAATYKEAGFLSKALEAFDVALKVNTHSAGNKRYVIKARQSLLKEMRKWTGTSSYAVLEEGCRRLQDEKIYHIQKMVPSQSNQVYLGGVAIGSRSRNPTCERYASLPRPLTLPPLHSSDAMFSGEEAKKAYLSIFNGDFTLAWIERGFELTITAECHLNGEFQGPLITMIYSEFSKETLRSAGRNNDHDMGGSFRFITQPLNSKFSVHTSENQKWALVLRVMHLFLRIHGVRLTSVSISGVCFALYSKYAERKWWTEAIDIIMIWIDVGFTLGNCSLIHSQMAFKFLGETLEAKGKFAEAGQVYQDAVEVYFPSSDSIAKESFHCNRGLAYKRAREYARAEKQYVAAIHYTQFRTTGRNWDLNHKESDSILTNVIVFYNEWCSETSNRFLDAAAQSEQQRVFSLFAALLFAAGFKASRGGLTAQIVLSGGPHLVKGCLKPELAKKKKAKQALESVTSTPNLSDFRSKILACERCNSHAVYGIANAREAGDDKFNRKSAQKQVQSQHTAATMTKCANPTCPQIGTSFMQCPCRSVAYCSKECQKTHWRAGHKLVCTTKTKKG